MSEPRVLVEHFFRHEFGRLCAVLTRSLGVRRLDLVEDVVQAALVQALETWSRRGVPEDPAGWLYRTARNLAIDALRRERTHAQALPRLAEDAERESSPLEAHFADEIGDEPLRLLFVCCHEAVPAESRVAIALRTLCGFSTAEIARALLTTDANVQKRIERARDRLRELDVDFDTPAAAQLCARLDAVLAVVYLLFSQGCHVTHGDMPIRRDLCDEARRLARMLAAHRVGDVPAVHALLALMRFHGARFDARVALDGAIVLLEEQDRSAWNWSDVREGMAWLARSAAGDELTRYHVEAGIAWEHCRGRPSPTPIGDGSPNCTKRSIASRRRRCTPSTARSPKLTCTARKPASTPGRRSSGKCSRPLSRLARGDRRVPFPPRPTLRRRARLAGSPTLYHCPGRSRILCRRLAVCRPDGGEPATE